MAESLINLIQKQASDSENHTTKLVSEIADIAMKNKKTYSEAISELRRNRPVSNSAEEQRLYSLAIEFIKQKAMSNSI